MTTDTLLLTSLTLQLTTIADQGAAVMGQLESVAYGLGFIAGVLLLRIFSLGKNQRRV